LNKENSISTTTSVPRSLSNDKFEVVVYKGRRRSTAKDGKFKPRKEVICG
jgi:hypothetical protein